LIRLETESNDATDDCWSDDDVLELLEYADSNCNDAIDEAIKAATIDLIAENQALKELFAQEKSQHKKELLYTGVISGLVSGLVFFFVGYLIGK
jgi:hypothetical protein